MKTKTPYDPVVAEAKLRYERAVTVQQTTALILELNTALERGIDPPQRKAAFELITRAIAKAFNAGRRYKE